MPAQASVALSTLKKSHYSIRFLGTAVPFDIPDPTQSVAAHWVGTISYDATLRFVHSCYRRRDDGVRVCV